MKTTLLSMWFNKPSSHMRNIVSEFFKIIIVHGTTLGKKREITSFLVPKERPAIIMEYNFCVDVCVSIEKYKLLLFEMIVI